MTAADTADIGDSGPASASRLTFFAGNAVMAAADLALARWRDEDRPAVAEYRYQAPRTTPFDPETGACCNSVSFSYAAQAVEVEVDTETGDVRVERVIAAQDPGRAVNPQQVRAQIEGAVVQAQGWAVMENFITEGGRVLTDRLSTYLIPTVRRRAGQRGVSSAGEARPGGPIRRAGRGRSAVRPPGAGHRLRRP